MDGVEVTPLQRIKIRTKRYLAAAVRTLRLDRLVERIAPRGVFIFCYHRIIDSQAVNDFIPFIAVSTENLEKHLAFLGRACNLLSLSDSLKRLRREIPLDRDAAVVTFDDGYRDNWTLGGPIFTAMGIEPTVFVTTAPTEGGGVFWADRLRYLLYTAERHVVETLMMQKVDTSSEAATRATLRRLMRRAKRMSPDTRDNFLGALAKVLGSRMVCSEETREGNGRLMLNWHEIGQLQTIGAEIGAHTHTHEIVTNLDESALTFQLVHPKTLIEERTGGPCVHFAYPNGARRDFSHRIMELLRERGFQSAATLIFGMNFPGADPFQLKRITITFFDTVNDLKLKMFRAKVSAIVQKWRHREDS